MPHGSASVAQYVALYGMSSIDWSGPVIYPPQKTVGVTALTASAAWETGLCDWKAALYEGQNAIKLCMSSAICDAVQHVKCRLVWAC